MAQKHDQQLKDTRATTVRSGTERVGGEMLLLK